MTDRPCLPLVLLDTPPGLEMILAQEGVPFVSRNEDTSDLVRLGRFVLFDGRDVRTTRLALGVAGERAIDVDRLRDGETEDPFEALLDHESARGQWHVAGTTISERIHRRDRSAIRHRLLGRLRTLVEARGGIWARLSPYPFPFRSAFAFRADLDEPYADDYARYASARRPIDDCSTHFVSTFAYGDIPEVWDDLRQVDPQSHGHFHHVYRDEPENAKNLELADRILRGLGIEPEGFAGPAGRWNPGLDRVLEQLGYRYSSDFQVGYDDLPFYPWRDHRFSKVLQIPIHPVCEGIFHEAGISDSAVIRDYYIHALDRKIRAGETAFLYGHPERRLGRSPEIVAGLAAAVGRYDSLWRTTLTGFARWWAWRNAQRVSLRATDHPGCYDLRWENPSREYAPAFEIFRQGHRARIRLRDRQTTIDLRHLTFERIDAPESVLRPAFARRRFQLREAVKEAIDWEVVTPRDAIHGRGLRACLKRNLRAWKERAAQ